MAGSLRFYELANAVIDKRFSGVRALADFEDRETMMEAVADVYSSTFSPAENSDRIAAAITAKLEAQGSSTEPEEPEDTGEIYRMVVSWSVGGEEYGIDTHYVTCNDTMGFDKIATGLAEKSHHNDRAIAKRAFDWTATNVLLTDLHPGTDILFFEFADGKAALRCKVEAGNVIAEAQRRVREHSNPQKGGVGSKQD